MIGPTLSHFRITSKLGEGGMGVVYLAEDLHLDRTVALKVLPAELSQDRERRRRFVAEAKAASSLNHPNVTHIYEVDDADGVLFIAMEHVEGSDLASAAVGSSVEPVEVARIGAQLAGALADAHDVGIVHRDLEPANIKITPDGTVKVLDFGLAKAWETETGADLSMSPTLTRHATAAGVILGTAASMSPEQARGQIVDRRADVWAFGVVLWEMLTGRQLYQGETVSDVLASVLKEASDLDALPVDTPTNLHRVVTRCLEKNPRQRLQWIGDARVELTSAISEEPRSRPVEGAAATPRRSHRLLHVAGGALIAIAAAAAGFLAGHRGPEGPRVVRFDLAAPEGTTYHLDGLNPGPVVVSHDGLRMAFTARDADGRIHLYVRTLEDAEPQLLSGGEGAQYPFWSPDSRSIGFFADGRLKTIDVDGGPALTLCDAANGKGGSWSASGRILFAPSYADPIHRVAEVGGEPTAVTSLSEERGDNSHRHPRFLPDGEHFIYLARTGDEDGQGGQAVVLASLFGRSTASFHPTDGGWPSRRTIRGGRRST